MCRKEFYKSASKGLDYNVSKRNENVLNDVIQIKKRERMKLPNNAIKNSELLSMTSSSEEPDSRDETLPATT